MSTNEIIGWVQNGNPDLPNSIYKDGQIITPTDHRKYSLLYSQIVNRKIYKKIYDKNGLSFYAKGNFDFLIYSNFIEKDIANRNIAFMSRLLCPIEEIETLMTQFAQGVSYTISAQDISVIRSIIDQLKKKRRYKKLIIYTLLIVLIVSLLILLIHGLK